MSISERRTCTVLYAGSRINLPFHLEEHCANMENKRNTISRQRRNILLTIRNFIMQHHEELPNQRNLKELLQLYKSLRAFYKHPRSNACPLNWVLRYIVEQSFWSKYDDSSFVVELIRYVLENDGHIAFLLLLNENLSHVNESQSLMSYFLSHARKEKMLINGPRGCRLTSVCVFYSLVWQFPVEMAVRLKSPILLHNLLKYGAVLSHQTIFDSRLCFTGTSRMIPKTCAILCADVLSLILNSFLELNPKSKHLCDLDTEKENDCRNLVGCGVFILRESPQLKLKFLTKLKFIEIKTSTTQSLLPVINKFDKLIPDLMNHFIQPLKLKQFCKQIIRKVLNDYWNLPHGIYQLHLPHCLKYYLDLYND